MIGGKCVFTSSHCPVDVTHLESVIQCERTVQPFHSPKEGYLERAEDRESLSQSYLSVFSSRHCPSMLLLLAESLQGPSQPAARAASVTSAIIASVGDHCSSPGPLAKEVAAT